jgi:hypothetical protein
MSSRAAWRLEALGFTEVHDYVASKADWFANGLPREGTSLEDPWAGDLVREAPTCEAQELVGDLRERVASSGFDFCVVVNEERVVAGLLRGDALAKDGDARAADVMELGPKTSRPSYPVRELLAERSSYGVKSWLVTTPGGALLGVLTRDDAEGRLEETGAAA